MTNKLNTINEYIINKNKYLYSSIYHIANPTLSRNPYMSEFLNYYLKYKKLKKISFLYKIKLVGKYFIKFYIRFFFYLLKFLIYKLFFTKSINYSVDYIIDVNFISNAIMKEKKFKDRYLQNLDITLRDNDNSYLYIMKSLIGKELNLASFYKIMKILNKSEENIVSEFDLLNFSIIVKIFLMSHIYPFKLLSIKTDSKDFIDKVFISSNIEALNSGAFRNFIRYFTGRELAKKINKTKIISVCEYKCHDKIFYKGIHDVKKDIFIYGCQFFISYPVWLNTRIPREEEQFNVTPNEVLVNGKYNLLSHTIKCNVGVSLRYTHIFNKIKYIDTPNQILILLSFVPSITSSVLTMCYNSSALKENNVVVRKHPVFDIEPYRDSIMANNWILNSEDTIEKQFQESSIIIVSGSGTALEAVASGKSVLIIEDKNTFLTNPLSDDIGKGTLWDIAKSPEEVDVKLNLLFDFRRKNKTVVKDLAEQYLNLYFSEPTKEKIKTIFKEI